MRYRRTCPQILARIFASINTIKMSDSPLRWASQLKAKNPEAHSIPGSWLSLLFTPSVLLWPCLRLFCLTPPGVHYFCSPLPRLKDKDSRTQRPPDVTQCEVQRTRMKRAGRSSTERQKYRVFVPNIFHLNLNKPLNLPPRLQEILEEQVKQDYKGTVIPIQYVDYSTKQKTSKGII